MRGIMRSDKDAWAELMMYIDNLFKRDHTDCSFKLFVNIIFDHFLNTSSVKMYIRYKLRMYAKYLLRKDFERKMLKLANCLSVSENGFTYDEGIQVYEEIIQEKLIRLKKLKKHAHMVGFCCLALKESLLRARERIFWSPGNAGYILASISFHSHKHLVTRQRSRSPRRV